MSELSNKDIDDIFQRGASRYDFEFKEEAWQQMESLLERDRRRRRLGWWLFGILLMMLLAWGAFQLLEEGSPESPAPAQQPPVAQAPPEPPSTEGAPAKTKRRLPGAPLPSASGNTPERRDAGDEPSGRTSAKPTGPDGRQQPPLTPITAEENGAGEMARQLEKTPPAPAAPLDNLPLAPPSATKRSMAMGAALPVFAPLERLPHRPAQPLAPALATFPAATAKQPPASRGAQQPSNSFVFGGSFTPESASIGTDDFGLIDFKAGLHLEYRFATHFAVGTGLSYTRKHYEAGRGEYTPEQGFWTRQIAPEQSYGYCSMLEVPVNFTYFFQRHDRNSLFLEAGLTNFIMLNEHYWYSYDRPDPDLIRYWQSEFEYHAWMSILNISPGYQLTIGSRFGLQAAPFLQIPLSGIGHGKVDLYSLGLNVRILFRTASR